MARPEEIVRVSERPERPTLVWDGSCDFCRRWVARWSALTDDKIDYVESQTLGERFREISREVFERSVVLIEPDGQVLTGAAAIFRAFSQSRSRSFLLWGYNRFPGFRAFCELTYATIARNRRLASALTRLLWGDNVGRPTYFDARRWFLRGLGLVYLVAFVSLWTQIDGLVGENGILPIGHLLKAAHEQIGGRAYAILPTLCWIDSGNAFLHFLCGAGVVLSVLLIVGIAPAFSLGALFLCYLSLSVAGQTFLAFQWDILLLETGFLAIFFAPWRLWPAELLLWRRNSLTAPVPISATAFFLLKLLLFKLMFMSGAVKLTSGDDSWWHLTALDYQYWSQPLPTVMAWWADQSPEWFKKMSVAFCLFVELIVPFFMWAPRRLRFGAAVLLILLQVGIALTGNYCFFNLLTVVLCILLFEDRKRKNQTIPVARIERDWRWPDGWATGLASLVLVFTLPLNAWHLYSACAPTAAPPHFIQLMGQELDSFRVTNGYGLFRFMTKDRREIEIEGSSDGIDWRSYEFKWKPDAVNRAPGWCAPHQPRLDWQMWFAALGSYRENPWFVSLAVALLENRPDVTALFARNPFPESAPPYLRARFYRYRFTNMEERRRTGAWWKREELGEYLPTISAEDVR